MIRFFLSTVKGYWGKVIISIVLSCLTVLSSVGLMGVSAYLIILAGFHPSIAFLQLSIVGVRFFGISRSIFRYLERLSTHQVNFRILGKIRLNVFEQFSSKYMQIMDKYSGSEILSIIISDIDKLENLYVRLMSPFFVALISSVVIGIFFGLHSLEIAFIYLIGFMFLSIVIPYLAIVISKITGRKAETAMVDYQASVINFYQFINEAIFYQRESLLINDLVTNEQKLVENQRNTYIWKSILNLVSYYSIQLVFLLILIVSALMVQEGKLEPMMMGVFSLMALASFEIVTNLPSNSYLYNDMNSSIKRILAINNIPNDDESNLDLEPIHISTIKLFNVSYTYQDKNAPALQDISFEIKRGEKIGFVGANGSGKTTLMEILMGYRRGYSGQILINKQEFRSIPEEYLRSKISYISANPYFFNTTIKQNLLLARKDVDDQTLRETLAQVGLFDPPRIDIDTIVAEQGKNFSSGELQRLAFAQAILKDGDLLIFDEPFENLDPISSQTFVELLNDLFEDRTMLFISHNYQHMKNFNKIVALDHGQLVGIGNYDQILNKENSDIYDRNVKNCLNNKFDFIK